MMLKLLLEWGIARRYFHEPFEYIFIAETTAHKVEVWRKFEAEGLMLKYVLGSRYMGYYLGSREELEEWLHPQEES